ncbi:hypothetical protein BN133_2656 [Cronobacter dublinensis 582]|nr:hypothetical protein BN133_2656 [Cronobacter dublinensis 582]
MSVATMNKGMSRRTGIVVTSALKCSECKGMRALNIPFLPGKARFFHNKIEKT